MDITITDFFDIKIALVVFFIFIFSLVVAFIKMTKWIMTSEDEEFLKDTKLSDMLKYALFVFFMALCVEYIKTSIYLWNHGIITN